MKLLTSSLAALTVVAGGAGATLAYQAAADAGPRPATQQPASSATAVAASPSATARPQVRLLPCQPPAELRHGACVTEVTRYVTPSPSASGRTASDDDRYDDSDDRYDDDRYDDDRYDSDDRYDDDHADDHGEHDGDDHGDDSHDRGHDDDHESHDD